MASLKEATPVQKTPLTGMLSYVDSFKSKLMDAKDHGVIGVFNIHELRALDLLCKMMIDLPNDPKAKLLYNPTSSPSSLSSVRVNLQSNMNKDLAKLSIDDKDTNILLQMLEDAIPFLSLKIADSFPMLKVINRIMEKEFTEYWKPGFWTGSLLHDEKSDINVEKWHVLAGNLYYHASRRDFTGSMPLTHDDAKLLKTRLDTLVDERKFINEATNLLMNSNILHRLVAKEHEAILEVYKEQMENLIESLRLKREKIYTNALEGFEGDKLGVARIAAHRDKLIAENHLLFMEKECLMNYNRILSTPSKYEDNKIFQRTGLSRESLSWDDAKLKLDYLESNIIKAKVEVAREENKSARLPNDIANALFKAFAKTIRESLGEEVLNGIICEKSAEPLVNVVGKPIAGLKYYDVSENEFGSGYSSISPDSDILRMLSCAFRTESFRGHIPKDCATPNYKSKWVCYPREEVELLKRQRDAASKGFDEVLGKMITDVTRCVEVYRDSVWDRAEAELSKSLIRSMHGDIMKSMGSIGKRLPACNRDGTPLQLTQTISALGPFLEAQIKKLKHDKHQLEDINASLRQKDATISELRQEKTKLVDTYREEAARPFLKQISARDREMIAKEAEMKHLRDSHHNREQGFKNKISELESNLNAAKEKLDKALKLPDKVREECFAKIQRGHNKVAKLERELKAEEEAHNITKLDSADTTDKLSRHKAQHERFVIKATQLKKERDEAREERDILRASRVTPAQLDASKASEIVRAVEESTKPLQDAIATSKATIASLQLTISKLQNDENMRKSKEAVAAIQATREIDDLKAKYRSLSEYLAKEREDRAQDILSRNRIESDLKANVAYYQSIAKAGEEAKIQLSRQLQEEQTESANLKEQIHQQCDCNTDTLLAQLEGCVAMNSYLRQENAQYRSLAESIYNVGRSSDVSFTELQSDNERHDGF